MCRCQIHHVCYNTSIQCFHSLNQREKYVPHQGANEPFTNQSDLRHIYTWRFFINSSNWKSDSNYPFMSPTLKENTNYLEICLQMLISWHLAILERTIYCFLHWLDETIFVSQYVFEGNIFWGRFPFHPVGVMWLTVSREHFRCLHWCKKPGQNEVTTQQGNSRKPNLSVWRDGLCMSGNDNDLLWREETKALYLHLSWLCSNKPNVTINQTCRAFKIEDNLFFQASQLWGLLRWPHTVTLRIKLSLNVLF